MGQLPKKSLPAKMNMTLVAAGFKVSSIASYHAALLVSPRSGVADCARSEEPGLFGECGLLFLRCYSGERSRLAINCV